MGEIFCGVDWAEDHHDVAIVDSAGALLVKRRISDDVSGFGDLTSLLAEHTGTDVFVPVSIGIETDRGLLVAALRAAGHVVVPINPRAVSRYRDRHGVSGAKSDPGDALVLAQIMRTDREVHRALPDDSEQVMALRVLARAHQDAVWARQQTANRLRSLLREFFPAALQAFSSLHSRTALTVLAAAPDPTQAARLTRANLTDLLHAAGRGTRPAEAARLAEIFSAAQLHHPAAVEAAMGVAVRALITLLAADDQAVRELEKALEPSFESHPDAEIIDSLPGLGLVLGARVLSEFGDDRTRWADAASRRCYAGTAPITRASGKGRVVLARYVRNRRLADACYLWAFSALTKSPGARAYYDQRRAAGDTHNRPSDASRTSS
ncbi:MAG: IS110 family transposase [Mycobacteriales bacterium]